MQSASSTNSSMNQHDPYLLRGAEIARDAENCTAIIDDELFLGNLSAAESPQLMARLGITHILSVCPDYLAIGANMQHLTLPMQDDEHFDILQHLPSACRFIQDGVDAGGRVFVHCVMGISRSATVVCAYLMFSQHISAARAIQVVRTRRPRCRPNYNFVRQLLVWSECNYNPSEGVGPYIAWKEQQEFDQLHSLRVTDGMHIIPNRLFLSFDFPSNAARARALLARLGITHIVSITPDAFSHLGIADRVHKHFIVPYNSKEALLLALPLLCQFVDGAIMQDGSSCVFVHCTDEVRGGVAICAYLMFARRIQPSHALEILQDRVPLFEDNSLVRRHLELFQACEYAPTQAHPVVRAWLSTPGSPVPRQMPSYVTVKEGKYDETVMGALFTGSVGA
ncbi:protein-tyrosine phosphatase-like protein [Mycena maculata]|uniref:protein-tyrosine-phosphatase n=1 Tax=Mycena maculata TaxID=230809 RepID=A0AAD7INH9_9AGAR|nr:protein-tyrosine phosphatase-like protein [Mycena maculata]